jgi:hypothetical protein
MNSSDSGTLLFGLFLMDSPKEIDLSFLGWRNGFIL